MRRRLKPRRSLLALTAASLGSAAEDDYRVENTRWNGLSELSMLARSRGHEVSSPQTLDLSQIDAQHDLVFVFYPRMPADAAEQAGAVFSQFVAAGGRLLVADDFGSAQPILTRLGAELVWDAPAAAESFRDNPALSLARPWGRHELGSGVGRVVLNHPAALRSRLTPVLVASLPVVVAGQQGTGRLVLCADPSLFINNMLLQAGNFAFAQNLLDWLGSDRQRLILLAQGFSLTGEIVASAPAAPFEMNAFLRQFNAFLQQIDSYLPLSSTLSVIGFLAVAGIVAIFVASGPRRKQEWDRAI